MGDLRPTVGCHFELGLSDSEIFSDTKHRAVCLRQLSSFLFVTRMWPPGSANAVCPACL